MRTSAVLALLGVLVACSSIKVVVGQSVVCKAKVDVAITVDSSTSINEDGHKASAEWLEEFVNYFDIRPDRATMTLHQHTVDTYGLKHWSVFDLVDDEAEYKKLIKDPAPVTGTPDPDGLYCWMCQAGSGNANPCPCLPSVQEYSDANGLSLCTSEPGSTPMYCESGGHSCTGCGLRGAIDAFDKSEREVAARILIVMSDFADNGSPSLEDGLAEFEAAYPDAIIIALAVGPAGTVNAHEASGRLVATDPEKGYLKGGSEDGELLKETLDEIQTAACVCRDNCGGHGQCFSDGTCLCDVGYQGETCSATFVPSLVAATAALAALGAALLGLHRFWGASAIEEEEEEIYEEPEVMEDLIIEAPMMIEPTMETDANAAGAPPATDNRPMFSPASRVQPTTFNRNWKAGGATFV